MTRLSSTRFLVPEWWTGICNLLFASSFLWVVAAQQQSQLMEVYMYHACMHVPAHFVLHSRAFCRVVTRCARVLNNSFTKGEQVQTEQSIDIRAIYIYILHNKEETEIIIRSNESRVHSHHTFLHHHANHANLLVATKFTRNVNSPIYALIYKGQIESWWYWWIVNAATYQQV